MGGVVSGFFGSSTPSPPNLQVWQPQNTGAADNTYWNLAQTTAGNNPYTANQPAYQNILNQNLNNPYASGAQTAANAGGAAYTAAGNADTAMGGGLANAMQSLLGAANTTWNAASDPNQALYNRSAQQTQDQIRASEAARGITNSGYGADLENEAMGNFNINWNTQQLANMLNGLNGLTSATTGAGQTATSANNLNTAGAGNLVQGGAIPYSTSTNTLNNQETALSNYGQQTGANANSLDLNTMASLLSYMGLGAQQSNNQADLNLQNWEDQAAYSGLQNQNLSSMFDSAVGGINNLGSTLIPQTWNSGGGSSVASILGALGY